MHPIFILLAASLTSVQAHQYFACLHAEACPYESVTSKDLAFCNAPFEGHKFIELTDQLSNTAVCARCQFQPIVSAFIYNEFIKIQ